MPRVVTAGVPIRIPEVTAGLRGSKGTMFLFAVMPARSSEASAALPVVSRSTSESRKRCVSVPPDTTLKPARWTPPARAFALASTAAQ